MFVFVNISRDPDSMLTINFTSSLLSTKIHFPPKTFLQQNLRSGRAAAEWASPLQMLLIEKYTTQRQNKTGLRKFSYVTSRASVLERYFASLRLRGGPSLSRVHSQLFWYIWYLYLSVIDIVFVNVWYFALLRLRWVGGWVMLQFEPSPFSAVVGQLTTQQNTGRSMLPQSHLNHTLLQIFKSYLIAFCTAPILLWSWISEWLSAHDESTRGGGIVAQLSRIQAGRCPREPAILFYLTS